MDELLAQLFASTGSESLAWEEVVLYILLAFLLSQVVAWVYSWTHRGLSYSRSQAQATILLSVIVTAVMLAIGNNVARAFGLFGALALIRFRTPIKDVRDTVFLFMAVAIGITLGTRNVMLGVVGTTAFSLIALYLSFSRFGQQQRPDAVLRLALPSEGGHEGLLRRVLDHYCRNFALMHARTAGMATEDEVTEFSYRIKLFDMDQSSGLLADLGTIPGVTGVDLLVHRDDEEI